MLNVLLGQEAKLFPKQTKLSMSRKCHLENGLYDHTKRASKHNEPADLVQNEFLLEVDQKCQKVMIFVFFVSMCCMCMSVSETQREREKERGSVSIEADV